ALPRTTPAIDNNTSCARPVSGTANAASPDHLADNFTHESSGANFLPPKKIGRPVFASRSSGSATAYPSILPSSLTITFSDIPSALDRLRRGDVDGRLVAFFE
ncbi:hypothetical protein, partial [Rhodococcus qingshengii]|uniref:hypothetical protein n=1 Tax=Rhodococcus qingshengii TaxID=334542 RepID=UPI001BE8B0E2